MVLVVLWGAYTVFLEDRAPKPDFVTADSNMDTLNAFVTKVAEAAQSGLSKADAYLLEQAQSAWQQNPMLNIEAPVIESEQQGEEAVDILPVEQSDRNFAYTGFLQMGDIRLAIINGMEYEAGDRLEDGGYTVQSITPRLVVLKTRGKGNTTFKIPLEEN